MSAHDVETRAVVAAPDSQPGVREAVSQCRTRWAWGIVPMNALARSYRDVIGRVNAIWAEAADDAFLAVAGRVLRLERA